MKNKLFFISFVLAFVTCVSSGSCLDEIDGYNTFVFTGDILEVNGDNGFVSVEEIPEDTYFPVDDQRTMTFPVTENTKFFQDADVIGFNDLTAGQRATIRYSTDSSGGLVTLSITVDG